MLNLAARLDLPVKGAGWPEGIQVLPRQDTLAAGEFGSVIWEPLGVHRGVAKRYWFCHADYTLEAQFHCLDRLRQLSEQRLRGFIVGKTIPPQFATPAGKVEATRTLTRFGNEFRILDDVQPKRKLGRNYVTPCASEQEARGDNLSISIEEPRKDKCWAGCTREMIRTALSRPIRVRRPA